MKVNREYFWVVWLLLWPEILGLNPNKFIYLLYEI